VHERFSMPMLGFAVVCAGCSSGASYDAALAEVAAASTVANGIFCNGIFANGARLDPLPLGGLRLGGQPLLAVSVDGAILSAGLPGGPRLSGSELAGADLAGTLSGGVPVTLRIDAVSAGSDPDVQRYAVSMAAAGAAYQPLCGLAAGGGAVLAIPLVGSWDESQGTPTGGSHVADPNVFTFACEGYALAKCAEDGYAPWRSVNECRAPGDCASRSLAPFHQACTRLLRADYCGDGTSTTRDGSEVDVWDQLGIQNDDQPSWALEAEWSAGGAVCVDRTRWATFPGGGDVGAYVRNHCPDRWQAPGCGGPTSTFFPASGFDVPLETRALLRSRVEGQPLTGVSGGG
jgi:hypothetical protein